MIKKVIVPILSIIAAAFLVGALDLIPGIDPLGWVFK